MLYKLRAPSETGQTRLRLRRCLPCLSPSLPFPPISSPPLSLSPSFFPSLPLSLSFSRHTGWCSCLLRRNARWTSTHVTRDVFFSNQSLSLSSTAEMRRGQRTVHGDAATALDVQPLRLEMSVLCKHWPEMSLFLAKYIDGPPYRVLRCPDDNDWSIINSSNLYLNARIPQKCAGGNARCMVTPRRLSMFNQVATV